MPFVLVKSKDLFMQKMDMIPEKCPGTLGIIDYLIVYMKMKEEHDQNLQFNESSTNWRAIF